MDDAMVAPASLFRQVPRAAALVTPSAAQRRPIVMVLGMHRSGTSLCSHILSALGVDMADQLGADGSPAFDNPKGHWERWEIVDLHDRILGQLNRAYGVPMHDFGFPVAWWADPGVAQLRREIVGFLRGRMGEGYFGFKDPRTVRLMPLWYQVVNELKLEPKIVFCLRNPAQVARSLQVRDGLDPEIGEARWFSYVVDFFRYTGGYDFCVIDYETWFNDAATNVDRLNNFLRLDWHQTTLDLELTVAGIVEAQLRHDDSRDREARQPLVRSLYDLTRRADREPSVRHQIQTIVTQFIAFQQLQRGVHRGFEKIAAAAARLSGIEQEAAALRSAIAEREASLDGAHARAQASEAREAEAVAELERRQALTVELVQKRNEIAAVAEAARAAEDSVRLALTDAEQRANALAAALASREEQLSEAEAGRERDATAAQERDAALKNAERAKQAQIAALRDELAASRKIVKSLLGALLVAPMPLPPPERTVGTWRTLFRLFRFRPRVQEQPEEPARGTVAGPA